MYLHQRDNWYDFTWDSDVLLPKLSDVRILQGMLLSRLESMGFSVQDEAELEMRTLDVLKSSEIEGESLNAEEVRSSVARQLGLETAGLVESSRDIDGVVQMTLDATHNYRQPLTEERLFGWNAALFPTGYSGMHKIEVAQYRSGEMQVVSGSIGREKIHYVAPDPSKVEPEMYRFLDWFNGSYDLEPIIKAAIAHLWFVSIHPFADGNGRITRAITDLLLARSDNSPRRFYSMSNQIRVERNSYYQALEITQKGKSDISSWLIWFIDCLHKALLSSNDILDTVFRKAAFWQKHSDTQLNDRQRLMIAKLQDGFEGKLTSSKWSKIAKTSQDTALRDIQDLINKGVLAKEQQGGRSTSYQLIW
jgi:Fic family protein